MKMFVTERRNKIMQLLHEKKRLTVKDLALKIGVSEATLRTDLNRMEEEGLLVRTHGGAVLNDYTDNETSFSVRKKKNKYEKSKIAEKAFEIIQEKQCILLDASSTALEIAHYLRKNPIRITVVTSGIHTAIELTDVPDVTVILIGGVLTKGSSSIEGKLGIDMLKYINIDIMFTSAQGFTFETGLTDFNLYEVELKKEMVRASNKVVALLDSSKIWNTSSVVFAETKEINVFITDYQISASIQQEFDKRNIQTIICN